MISTDKNLILILVLFLGIILLGHISAVAHDSLHEQIEEVTRSIKKEPRNPKLYLKRAELYRLHKEWKNSAKDIKRAEKLNPKLAVTNLLRGKLLFDIKNFNKAEKSLKKYLQKDAESFEGNLTLARVYSKQKKTEEAFKYFTKAIIISPDDSIEIYLERAKLLAGENQFKRAIKGLDEGISKLGQILTLQNMAINLEVKRQNYDSALKRLDRLMEKMPRKESFQLREGEIYLQAGQYCRAKEILTKSQKGFASLPGFRKKVRAIKEKIDQLDKLLQKATEGCAA
jgi:predicted Zn-dependent protease